MANVIDGADMRMIQAGDSAGFTLESLSQISAVRHMVRQDLDCDDTVQTGITSTIDHAHAARTRLGEDLIRPEFGA
jgi:hypothetical protein